MSYHLVVTAMGTDRPGIINELVHHVSGCGCNIVDSRLAIFGSEFTFLMLLSGEWNALTQLEASLPLKSQQLDLISMVKRTTPHDEIHRQHALELEILIPDSPGIIEQFTQFFADHSLNIEALRSETLTDQQSQAPLLKAHFSLTMGSDAAPDRLRGELINLCDQLKAQHTFRIL